MDLVLHFLEFLHFTVHFSGHGTSDFLEFSIAFQNSHCALVQHALKIRFTLFLPLDRYVLAFSDRVLKVSFQAFQESIVTTEHANIFDGETLVLRGCDRSQLTFVEVLVVALEVFAVGFNA